MELDDYVKKQEVTYCEVPAQQARPSTATSMGTLACTQARLVFSNGNTVSDIRLDSIDELRFSRRSYLNGAMLVGAGLVLLALLLSVAAPSGVVPQVPLALSLLLLTVGIVTMALAFHYAKPTLVVHTPRSKYKFRAKNGNQLAQIPHAVRGGEL